MPDTPLNPDALEAAYVAVSDESWLGATAAREVATAAVSAYLAAALPEVTSVDPQDSYRCDACRKYITLTKAGVFRHHRGNKKEYPGSPWNKVCEGVGKKP